MPVRAIPKSLRPYLGNLHINKISKSVIYKRPHSLDLWVRTRKIITMNHALHPRSNTIGFYLPRSIAESGMLQENMIMILLARWS